MKNNYFFTRLLRLLHVTSPYKQFKTIKMTNLELMQMSLQELSELNKRIIEVSKLKRQEVSFVNKEQLSIGMVAEYIGSSTNIHYKDFEVVKINRTKAKCKCLHTGSYWDIQISNLKPTEKKLELSHSIIDRTEKQPNNIKQW